MRLKLLSVLIAVTCILCAELLCAQELVMGIHPYNPSAKLIEKFTPLAAYLSKVLGQEVSIKISKNYEEHIARIGNNNLDIAYMGPASYVKLISNYGPRPLLAKLEVNGKPYFRGMIVTSAQSNIKSIGQLRGARFAFGDPQSTMSHFIPRFMLLKAGIEVSDLSKYSFLSNHDNVALGVLMGYFDAGAVKEETYTKYNSRGLTIIEVTPAISEHLFVASQTMNPIVLDTLQRAMIALYKSADGMSIIRSIKSSATGLVPVLDKDYDNLRQMLSVLEENGISP
ncbi:MAG: phosphate/phosphite/phosphonate ABC transporter substrate-binding protein [Nitrospira sp.]|nr:phosphate/phosphite/phosphonate ABC transporter substrate-binding protein [bacterium]MBL7049092.1 phosphate/phosphite/phosphonate ABC transporter substrate-binding protein [Nitrospira sp.]